VALNEWPEKGNLYFVPADFGFERYKIRKVS